MPCCPVVQAYAVVHCPRPADGAKPATPTATLFVDQSKLDEVKENIEKNLEARKSRQAKQTLLDSLREAAKVEVLVEGLSFNPTTKKGATPPVLTPIPKK